MVSRSHPLARLVLALFLTVFGAGGGLARGDTLSDIGVTILRSVQPTLQGTGVSVIIAEPGTVIEYPVGTFTNQNDFQISPLTAGVIAPITYINNEGLSAMSFPNDIGTVSSHANLVASHFVGTSTGVTPAITRVFNYEASYFVNEVIIPQSSLLAKVINQSFVLDVTEPDDAPLLEQAYDNFVVNKGVIIVTGAGNGEGIRLPASAYNVIAVGAFGGTSSVGPINGRSKPDIVAPGAFTSFSTPLVSGVATALVQAGIEGHGGDDTITSAVDPRTVKALILASATKPSDWAHTSVAPLDPRHGAGIVNAWGSHQILSGGKQAVTSSHSTPLNQTASAVNSGTLQPHFGWNLQSITSNTASDRVHHYLFDLGDSDAAHLFTAALTWNRPFDNISDGTAGGINNLDMYLFDAVSNMQIALSVSTVDNVEYIHVPGLDAGRYDLQVVKRGGLVGSPNVVGNTDTYALAWSAALLGDANWDGSVDIVDLATVANSWQNAVRGVFNGDLNGDGIVDIVDLATVANSWQNGTSTALMPTLSFARAVPEPATLSVLVLGAGALLRRRR